MEQDEFDYEDDWLEWDYDPCTQCGWDHDVYADCDEVDE